MMLSRLQKLGKLFDESVKEEKKENAKRKNKIQAQRRKRATATRSSGAQARAAPSSNGALRQTAIFPHSKFRKNLAQPSSIPFLFSFVSLSIFIAVISRSALRAVLCAQRVCERKEVRKKARKRRKHVVERKAIK